MEPDEKCLANDIGIRHKTPDTTVLTVVPIITHRKIMADWYFADETVTVIATLIAVREASDIRYKSWRVRIVQAWSSTSGLDADNPLPACGAQARH